MAVTSSAPNRWCCGDDQGGTLGAFGDHLEQELGSDVGQRHVELVEARQHNAVKRVLARWLRYDVIVLDEVG
jgi:hypothetical protein